MKKQYLGDAVFVAYDEDGYHLVLTVENGIQATETIYLEPHVVAALLDYIERTRAEAAGADA